MIRRIHLSAALVAATTLVAFLLAAAIAGLFGEPAAVARVRHLLVSPGLFVLVPALALLHGTGNALAHNRQGALIEAKKWRMAVVGGVATLVLLPCVLVLDLWAGAGRFDLRFYAVQALELLAGAGCLVLVGLNIRDGLRLHGRRRPE